MAIFQLKRSISIVAGAFSLFSIYANAQYSEKLTPLETYVRCYSKLTLQAPTLNDPKYLAVKAGTLNPVTACMSLVKKATMTGTEAELSTPSSVLSGADGEVVSEIIRNFHNFHRSWFPQKLSTGTRLDQVSNLIRDAEEPSLYLTRALFGQVGTKKIPYSSVTTYNSSLTGLRKRDLQPTSSTWTSKSFFTYAAGITYDYLNLPMGTVNNPASPDNTIAMAIPDNQLVQFGDLYGVKNAPPVMISRLRAVTSSSGRGTASDIKTSEVTAYVKTSAFQNRNLNEHLGGGILGSQQFYLSNSNLITYQLAYRERLINRRFASRVQEILMCHTLPNLLPGDVSGEVDTTSEYPFRKSASCMQCHSAIDPMAGTVRNLMIYTTANDTFSNTELKLGHPAYGVGKIATNLSKTDYVFTPTTGRLFYRDFQNKLVSENVSSLAALGTKVSSSFDFYACAAKRYYYFLTGIDVALNNVPGESELSAYHRKEVFTLATRLKSHQNLMTLIEDILKSDTFQTRNYKSESVGDP